MRYDTPIGAPSTKLIVIRGNSGSGKSTVARQLQLRYGRGCALIEQDYLRRRVLRERDLPGGLAPALIGHTTRFALDHHYHAVLEGILLRRKYEPMISALRQAHRGATHVFYLDVSLEETLRRHTTRAQATEFTAEDMRGWYNARDLLGFADEHVVPEASSIEATIAYIAATADLPLTARDDDFLPPHPPHPRPPHPQPPHAPPHPPHSQPPHAPPRPPHSQPPRPPHLQPPHAPPRPSI